jgi:hypothetical protein
MKFNQQNSLCALRSLALSQTRANYLPRSKNGHDKEIYAKTSAENSTVNLKLGNIF